LGNKISRSSGFGALLFVLPALVFVASLFWPIIQAPAQVQTYNYIGPAFDVPTCQILYGTTNYPQCVGGNITGSITTVGTSVVACSFDAGAAGSLACPVYSQLFFLGFSGGYLDNGQFDLGNNVSVDDPYIEIFTSGTLDSADLISTSNPSGPWYLGYGPGTGTWSNPKSLGTACSNQPGVPTCGEPINLSTGNVFDQVTDYETAGQNKLSLIRYYNSFAMPDTYATSMGVGWRTNYDRYLHIINPSAIYGVEAERPDGAVISFTSSSGTYTPDSDVDMTLTVSGSTWTLTDHEDTVETYSQSGSKATLQSIKKRGGYTQALTYSSGQISYVSDSYARQLAFSYSSGRISSVTTPDSLTLSYGYVNYTSTSQYRLQSVTYNTSPSTTLTYLYENTSYPFALTGITDENGNRYATWGYDGNGRGILSELSGAVNYTSVYYNDTNGNRVVKGPLGIVETYKFATLQGVPKVTEIDRAANGSVASATETFGYDSNGFLRSKNDWNGNNTTWVNNSHGLPTAITYASATTNAQTTNITYDLSWPHLQHTIATQGTDENFTYSSSGNLLTDELRDTATASNTRTWTYTYNRTGQLLTAQSPRSDLTAKTTYGYAGGTSGGTLISITDALSHVTTINTATGGGLPEKWTDPNGFHHSRSYNTRNWLTSSVLATSAGNLTTSFTYDSAGNLTKTTLPDNSYLSTGYDNAHRPTSITNALSESAAITYDSAGDITQTLWKNASSVTKRQHTATYDALGRKLTDVGGQSQTTSFTYDNNDNIISITDPLSHIAYRSVDQLNRVTKVKDQGLSTASISYDSHNRPLTVTDAKGNTTTFTYDGLGNTTQISNPDTLTSTYKYDSAGNLTKATDARSVVTNYTWDALDRMLTRQYPADSSLNASITYDSARAGYHNAIGHIASLTDQTGSLSRSYDERGNILFDSRTLTGQLYKTGYTYESAGRLSSITYASSGTVINYGRDAAGQISYVSATPHSSSTVNLASYIKHMPFGPASSWTYGNGVTDTRTFDQDYRMTSVKDHGTSDVQYLSYSWNAFNTVTAITDHVSAAKNQTFTYDRTGQITFASGTYGTASVTYDSNSNRLTAAGFNYTYYTGTNRLKKWGISSVTYTSTGNIASIGLDAVTYNKANQTSLVAIHGGVSSGYNYDAFGQRLKIKTGTSPFQVQMYDLSGHMLTETSQAASPVETDYVYMDDLPIAAIQSATSATPAIDALHTDTIGTVQRATNSTKTTVWTGDYNPCGAVTPTTTITMDLRFPGQIADPTGLYHNGFRDKSNVFCTYVQADPLGLAPWLEGLPSASVNGYPYALNNPITNTDPSGLDVTIRIYKGAKGLGHIGIGVAPHGQTVPAGQTLGFYPLDQNSSADLLGAPGVLRLDLGATPYPGLANTLRISTTPQQDEAITAYLNNILVHPGNYSLIAAGHAQNCAVGVENALRSGGIDPPQTIVPIFFIPDFERMYSQ